MDASEDELVAVLDPKIAMGMSPPYTTLVSKGATLAWFFHR